MHERRPSVLVLHIQLRSVVEEDLDYLGVAIFRFAVETVSDMMSVVISTSHDQRITPHGYLKLEVSSRVDSAALMSAVLPHLPPTFTSAPSRSTSVRAFDTSPSSA